MVTKKQGKAYAVITLDLLYKMKVKIDPETLSEQMSRRNIYKYVTKQ